MYHIRALITVLLFASLGIVTGFSGPSDPKRFDFITLPTAGLGPCDIDTGPDGESIWYRDLKANVIGVYHVKTKKIQEFAIPEEEAPGGTGPRSGNHTVLLCFVRTGKDGNIYSGTATGRTLIQVNPKTETIRTFSDLSPSPDSPAPGINEASTGEHGLYLALTAANSIVYLDYKTLKTTTYHLPTPQSGPLGLRVVDDGALWFTEFFGQRIGRLNNTSQKIQEFALPLPEGGPPAIMRAYTQGKYLWANSFDGPGGFFRINTAKPPGVDYIPAASGGTGDFYPNENDNDSEGRIWFSSASANTLDYYTPSSQTWTNIVLPGQKRSYDNRPLPIHFGPLNSMWFTNLNTNQLAAYKLG